MSTVRNLAKRMANRARVISVVIDARRVMRYLRMEHRAGSLSQIEVARRILRSRLLTASGQSILGQSELFDKTCRKARVRFHGESFVYSPDFGLLRMLQRSNPCLTPMGNLPIDFSPLLEKGTVGLRKEIEASRQQHRDHADRIGTLHTFETACHGLEVYAERCRQAVVAYGVSHPERKEASFEVLESFNSVLLHPAQGLRSALQTVLLADALFWTTGMTHVGLGRLDQLLLPFYQKDIDRGVLNEESALFLLKEFLRLLHRDFYAKSAVLPGDTGQVITISGSDLDGRDLSNPLTLLLLKAIEELHLPDPKLVLRVHSDTPKKIWEAAEKCMLSGTGSPLLSNDNRVVPALEAFGFQHEDSIQYATSACWEPCIPGLSVDQNNAFTFNFMEPLQEVLSTSGAFADFISLQRSYLEKLTSHVNAMVQKMLACRFQSNAFLSLLVKDCIERGLDVANGGAKYLNLGITTTALGNTVNSLLNIERLVFDEKSVDLANLCACARNNFEGRDVLLANLLAGQDKFGTNSARAAQLSNELIACVGLELQKHRTRDGGRFRFGVSSPSHVAEATGYPATLDGRRKDTPFGVHISPCSSGRPVAAVETAHFAAQLDYEKALNGGVLDVVMDKAQIDTCPGLLGAFFKAGCAKGIFQAQVNLVDAELLKDAKLHPENHADLIVRVWGFSAYFKDLPVEYQDVLIKRTEQAHAAGF